MIKYINKNIEIMNHTDDLVNKVMYMDSVAYERMDGESGYTPTPPTFEGKFKYTYSDGHIYSGVCNSSTTATMTDVIKGGAASAVTDAEWGDCVTKLYIGGTYALTNLSAATIPNSVEIICDTFRLSKIKNIVLPNSVKVLSGLTFAGSDLETITIPYGVETILNDVFSGTKLSSIVIPNSVKGSFGSFSNCASLSAVTLSNKITELFSYCFQHCISLEFIELPASISKLGSRIFYGCNRLRAIKVLNPTPPSIEAQTFFECNAQIYVPDESVDLYKNTETWSSIASRIHPLSEYQG
jgi:hypothetical protein